MKNPYVSAMLASAYIVGLVSMIDVLLGNSDEGEMILVPMMMLSLLVLSVATMGFLFFYQPLIMILDGRRAEGVAHFLKTVATFAVLTFVLVGINVFVLA